MKNRILLILSILTFNICVAQENPSKDIFKATLRYHYGVVLPHHKSISYLVNDQIAAIELNIGIIPSNKRMWAKMYNQPETGIGFYHGSLGNSEVLGKVSAVYPYINFNLKDFARGGIKLQTGFGVAYTQKHFDPVENYTNVAIGSRFNAFFKLLLNGSYILSNKWSLNGGVGFQHISNGSVNVPNKGLNLLTGNFGISYNYIEYKRTNKKKERYTPLNNEFIFVLSGGIKRASEIDSHKYFASSFSSGYSIGINPKQRIGAGVDFFYDEAANRGDWNLAPKTNFKNRFSQAFFLSHDLVIQRFSILLNIGYYTIYEKEPEKPIYTRIGLRYQLSEKILTNLSLKAHLGKADFIEWGVGYRIVKKKRHDK